VVIPLLAAKLHARAIDLLCGAALAAQCVDRHEGRAHGRLCQTQIVRARDLERLPEGVQCLRRIAAARAHVDESTLGPAECRNVGALLLERERAQISALCRIELAEQMVELRERERFGELAGAVGEQREHRLRFEMSPRAVLDFTEIGV
jgi:hypothetical protein